MRLPLGLAAGAFVTLSLWLAIRSTDSTSVPLRERADLAQEKPVQKPQDNDQDSASEKKETITRAINQLGSDQESVRENAKKNLIAIGKPALDALDLAYYHDNPKIRSIAKDLADAIRKHLEVEASVAGVHAGIKKVRARWMARDFKDIEEVTREVFGPSYPWYVKFVPNKVMGDPIASKQIHALTEEMAARLDREPGLIFLTVSTPLLDADGRGVPHYPVAGPRILDYSQFFVFTLPDKAGWSAYVLVGLGSEVVSPLIGSQYMNFASRLLASADTRQVWGIHPDEIKWVSENMDIVFSGFKWSVVSTGGLKIETIGADSLAGVRGFQAGDILTELNGRHITSVRQLRELVADPAIRQQTGIRLKIERAGTPLVIEYRPLPK
jgi:hypothetical protein